MKLALNIEVASLEELAEVTERLKNLKFDNPDRHLVDAPEIPSTSESPSNPIGITVTEIKEEAASSMFNLFKRWVSDLPISGIVKSEETPAPKPKDVVNEPPCKRYENMATRACLVCNHNFKPGGPRSQYCPECKARYGTEVSKHIGEWKKQAELEKVRGAHTSMIVSKTCTRCHKRFDAPKTDHSMYCPACVLKVQNAPKVEPLPPDPGPVPHTEEELAEMRLKKQEKAAEIAKSMRTEPGMCGC